MWLYGAALLVFGVLLPWIKGIDVLDALPFLVYGLLAVALTGPLALRLPAGRAILLGWGGAMLMAALAVGTVNLTHRYGTPLLPGRAVLAATILLSLAGCVAVAGGAAVLDRHHRNPRMVLRGILLAVLLGFLISQRVFPETLPGWLTEAGLRRLTWAGTPILLAAGAALQWIARR